MVFIWFGALKVVDLSPVSDLVSGSIPATDSSLFVPLLGGFEVALGLGLIAGHHPVVITAAIVHLAGTFLVLITQPELAFQDGNPLLLTTEGEFVVKNLVLLAAAVAVADAGVERRAQGAETHGNPAFTIDTCQHVLPGMQARSPPTLRETHQRATTRNRR